MPLLCGPGTNATECIKVDASVCPSFVVKCGPDDSPRVCGQRLADALAKGCKAVITVGGIQSNHARATAAAARRVGLTPHIILNAGPDPEVHRRSLVGNLMVDRLVGAKIHLIDSETFATKGGWPLVCELKDKLASEGVQAYAFPSGGSNALGTWGYIEAVREIEDQLRDNGGDFDRVYFACGSGGTGAGLALGLHYSSLSSELVGLGVDDSPDFFYDKLDKIMGECHPSDPSYGLRSRELMRITDCVGLGYAQATDEELRYVAETARATGVVMDPVYTGKALLGMVRDLNARPVGRALFVHTGGLLGVFAKAEQIASALPELWADE